MSFAGFSEGSLKAAKFSLTKNDLPKFLTSCRQLSAGKSEFKFGSVYSPVPPYRMNH